MRMKKDNKITFYDTFERVKQYHKDNGKNYGFELRRNGKWIYGDIEFNPETNIMSCMGVSIHVLPNTTILDAEEDLFEALLNAGYETDF